MYDNTPQFVPAYFYFAVFVKLAIRNVIYRVNLIESRMASVRIGNKETLSCDNKRGKGLEEDFKQLKLKDEICLTQEGGKKKQETEKAEVKKEQGKTTGKEVVAANKEETVEVGPEEFLKHPLQVVFVIICTHIMLFIQSPDPSFF